MAKQGSLTEKTGVVVFARIVNTLIDLALVVVVIQILSKTDFAVIGYLLMVHEIVRNLATVGFPESIFYYFERITENARKAFVLQTAGILAIMGILAGCVMLGVSYVAPVLLGGWQTSSIESVQHLLPLMALVTVLEVPTWPVTNILLAMDRQKESAWYEMLTSGLSFICLAGPLILGYSLTTAIYGLVIYAVIRFIGSMIWVMAVTPPRLQKKSGISLKRQFKFSVPLGFSSLVGKINRYVDKFIVSILLPVTAFAEYSIAAQEVPIIRVIPFAVGAVLISRYVKLQLASKKEELLALWYKGIKKVSLMVIPLTMLCIISASDLIALIAGSPGTSYQDAVLPFQIYNLIVLLRVTNYGSILQAFGDTKGIMFLSFNLVIANILLCIPFTIWWGIIGTASATLLANIYSWYIALHRIGRHMELKPFEVLPMKFYSKVLAIAVIIAIPVWAGRFYFLGDEQTLLGLAWSFLVYLGLFGLIGTITGIITRREWQNLKNWITLRFLTK